MKIKTLLFFILLSIISFAQDFGYYPHSDVERIVVIFTHPNHINYLIKDSPRNFIFGLNGQGTGRYSLTWDGAPTVVAFKPSMMSNAMTLVTMDDCGNASGYNTIDISSFSGAGTNNEPILYPIGTQAGIIVIEILLYPAKFLQPYIEGELPQ